MRLPLVNKELRVIAIVIFATLVCCMLILELGLRVIGRGPSNASEDFLEEFGKSYRLKMNVTKTVRWPGYTYKIYTNSFGFRDTRIGTPKLDGHPYYVFLGSSEVFAQGVDYEKTFVGIFSERASGTGTQVLNMAVGGHHLLTQESLFKDFLKKAQRMPSKVFLCVNPLLIAKFDVKNEDIVILNGRLFPKEGYRKAFVKHMILENTSVYCFFRDGIRRLQSKWMGFQQKHEADEFLAVFSRQNRMHDADTLTRFQIQLGEFERFCDQRGIQVTYVYLPLVDAYGIRKLLISLGLNPDDYDPTYYEKLMGDYCIMKKVPFLNLGPVLKKYFDAGIKLRFNLDAHYNEFSNRIIGDYLVDQVLSGQR